MHLHPHRADSLSSALLLAFSDAARRSGCGAVQCGYGVARAIAPSRTAAHGTATARPRRLPSSHPQSTRSPQRARASEHLERAASAAEFRLVGVEEIRECANEARMFGSHLLVRGLVSLRHG